MFLRTHVVVIFSLSVFFLMCIITQRSTDWKTHSLCIHLFTHNTEPLYDLLHKPMNQQILALKTRLSSSHILSQDVHNKWHPVSFPVFETICVNGLVIVKTQSILGVKERRGNVAVKYSLETSSQSREQSTRLKRKQKHKFLNTRCA